MNKIFCLDITTSYNNEGDILINRALIENLSSIGVIYLNKNKKPKNFILKITKEIPNVILIDNFYYKLFSKLFTGKVYLITTPGHSFGIKLEKFFSNIISSIFFVLLRLLGAKIIKLGGSSGPFGKLVRMSEIVKAKSFNFYGQRDSASIELLKLDFEKNYFPDLAFISNDILLAKAKKNIQNSKVIISFRPNTNDQQKHGNYLDLVLKKLKSLLLQLDKKELIFCYQVPSDRDFNYSLYQELKESDLKVEFLDKKLELTDALKIYQNAFLILSNRLHILLPAMIMNVKHIPIIDKNEHKKITSIYEDLGLSNLIFDVFSEENKNIIGIQNNFSEITNKQKNLALEKIKTLTD